MADLSELLLNRFLFRDNSPLNQNNVLSTQYNNPGPASSGGGGDEGDGTVPAENVAPGTVIQSCIIQSSGSDDRIEINPDDTFRAYSNGSVVVKIDSNGIDAEVIVVADLTALTADINELTVNDEITYQGVIQPIIYGGIVSFVGAFVFAPPGWTVVRNALGDYTITHNMAVPLTEDYTINASPINGHFRCRIPFRSANAFQVTWQQSEYVGGSYPVTGGGGGTVNIPSGIYNGEVAVDVSFYFIVARYLDI